MFHMSVEVCGRAVMFCTNCGKSCVSNAKYCHTCGKHLSESTAKEESTQNEKVQSSGGDAEVIEATGRMSFAQSKGRRSDKKFYQKEWKKVEVRNQRETIIKSVNMENSNWNYDKQGRRSTG